MLSSEFSFGDDVFVGMRDRRSLDLRREGDVMSMLGFREQVMVIST